VPKLKGHKAIPKRRKAPTGTLITRAEAALLPPPPAKRRKYQMAPEDVTWSREPSPVPPVERRCRKYALVQ
jgi:hypothetical protein